MVLASGSLQAADGAKLYEAHCVACHQPDGNGAEGLAPPLAGVLAKRAQSTSGREYLAQVLVSGMIGTITSRGVKYNGNMPAAPLSDEELVAVMGHVLATFNGVSQPLPAELFQRRPEQGADAVGGASAARTRACGSRGVGRDKRIRSLRLVGEYLGRQGFASLRWKR
jgi:cytochrome c553